jgi:hypothetical protein
MLSKLAAPSLSGRQNAVGRKAVVPYFHFSLCNLRVLCATSVFSVSLWWFFAVIFKPTTHREHGGCTENFKLGHHQKSRRLASKRGMARFRNPRPLLSAFCLLPSAFYFLPSAFCLLPSAFCLLLSAFYFLPTALLNCGILSHDSPKL